MSDHTLRKHWLTFPEISVDIFAKLQHVNLNLGHFYWDNLYISKSEFGCWQSETNQILKTEDAAIV